MHITEALTNDTVVLNIEGRLDAASVPTFKTIVKAHMDSGRIRFVADLHNLTFIDSSGLGILALLLRQAMQLGGDIKICGLSSEMQMLFALTRLYKVFEIHETVESALSA